RDDVFPSRFLKCADLNGKSAVLTIKSASLEKLKNGNGEEETKTVIYFEKAKKGLILNRTNWDKIAELTGEDDSDNWPGSRVEVFPATTEMRGKTVDCIRVRAPAQQELPKPKPAPAPTPASEMDDEIPF